MPLFALVGSPGTIGGASGGKVTGLNNVGTVGAQVIGGNPQRVSISFHNPGTQNLFAYPMVQSNGSANAPSNASPGGAFVIYPATTLTMSGECQGAWGCFAAANANNPLTISESNLTSG